MPKQIKKPDLSGIATLSNDKLATYTIHGKPTKIHK